MAARIGPSRGNRYGKELWQSRFRDGKKGICRNDGVLTDTQRSPMAATLWRNRQCTNTRWSVSDVSLLNGFCRGGRHCFSGRATSHDENE